MSKILRPLIVFCTLTSLTLACALPVPSASQPAPGSGTMIPSPDPNQVASAVAMTLTSLAPAPAMPTVPAPTSAPGGSTTLLPHTIYYLATDSAGLLQVFWMEQDGKTRHQITSEPGNVSDYDVSPVD